VDERHQARADRSLAVRASDTSAQVIEPGSLSPLCSVAPSGLAVPPAVPVPFARSVLPGYILDARNRIWQAQERGFEGRSATQDLRNAIDAFLSGEASRAQREAHAATEALPKLK
jgi:hypothetical protein